MRPKIVVPCVLGLAPLFALAWPLCASAHPYEGTTLLEVPPAYGICSLPAEADFAEISFTHEFPAADTLSAAEIFTVAGSEDSPFSQTSGFLPWWQYVLQAVRAHHSRYGYIPDQLSEELLIDVLGSEDPLSNAWLDLYKSPLTEQYPRLDVLENSPGDLYVRELSEQEITGLAEYHLSLKTIYLEHKFYPEGMYADPGLRSTQYFEDVTDVGPVFFVRVHGWNGVIWELVTFNWTTAE